MGDGGGGGADMAGAGSNMMDVDEGVSPLDAAEMAGGYDALLGGYFHAVSQLPPVPAAQSREPWRRGDHRACTLQAHGEDSRKEEGRSGRKLPLLTTTMTPNDQHRGGHCWAGMAGLKGAAGWCRCSGRDDDGAGADDVTAGRGPADAPVVRPRPEGRSSSGRGGEARSGPREGGWDHWDAVRLSGQGPQAAAAPGPELADAAQLSAYANFCTAQCCALQAP